MTAARKVDPVAARMEAFDRAETREELIEVVVAALDSLSPEDLARPEIAEAAEWWSAWVVEAVEESEAALRAAAQGQGTQAPGASLLAWVRLSFPGYLAGWFHRELAAALEWFSAEVAAGRSPRLILEAPPRHGKSLLVSQRWPVWHMANHPGHEVVCASYGADLAKTHSRAARRLAFNGPGRDVWWPDWGAALLDQADQWEVPNGAKYKAVGVGGAVTGHGAHCFPAGTLVATPEGPRPIEGVLPGDRVWSYDRARGTVVVSTVLATMENPADEFVEVEFDSGRVSRSTPEHPYFVHGRGYVPAADLRPGDEGITLEHALPRVWEAEDGPGAGVPALLRRDAQVRRDGDLQLLRGVGDEEGVPDPQGHQAGEHRPVLLDSVQPVPSCDEEPETVPGVRHPLREEDPEVLLRGLSPCSHRSADDASEDLPGVLDGVPAPARDNAVLRARMRECGARAEDVRRVESTLAPRGLLLETVQADAPADSGEGRREVRGLRAADRAPCAPHRREHLEQQPVEPHHPVRGLPCGAPQVGRDTVSVVRRASGERQPVYDIQVEGTSCFFAGGVLVHNCLIIDDPVKNSEQARSKAQREKVWAWYTGDAYTRLAPGGGVLVMHTRWHEDDLVGRLLAEQERGGDQWRRIRFPAIAEEDEEHRRRGEALHPERYPLHRLEAIRGVMPAWQWAALYQQRPTPLTGGTFQRGWLTQHWAGRPADLGLERRVVSVDATFKGGDGSDFVVFQSWGARGAERYLLAQVRARMNYPETKAALRAFVAQERPDAVIVEDKANGSALVDDLKSEIVGLIPVNPGTRSKEERAEVGAVPAMQAMQVHLPPPEQAPWVGEYVEELCAFPKGTHDDQVDATAQALLWLRDPHGIDPDDLDAFLDAFTGP